MATLELHSDVLCVPALIAEFLVCRSNKFPSKLLQKLAEEGEIWKQ